MFEKKHFGKLAPFAIEQTLGAPFAWGFRLTIRLVVADMLQKEDCHQLPQGLVRHRHGVVSSSGDHFIDRWRWEWQ